MIQNERQYRITKAKLKEFEESVVAARQMEWPTDPNQRLLHQAYIDAFDSQIEEFQEDIAEYERLKQGNAEQLTVDTFEKLPEALIQARIVRGLTQEQLADRLQVKPQQVQRDEANLYASASFSKLLAILKALDIDLSGAIALR